MDPKIEIRFDNIAKSKTFKHIVSACALGTKSVLDIGCSFGEFLIHFGKGSVGVTIIDEEIAYGKVKGLDIRYGNVDDNDFVLDQKFDAIFANNIFEHLYAPHSFLIKCKDYLRPGGMLVLGVPCIPKVVSLLKAHNKFRGSLADSHINFFTKDTLIKTVERAGYTVHMARGFHFASAPIDHLFDAAYPHFYIVATPDPNFAYSEKRLHGHKV